MFVFIVWICIFPAIPSRKLTCEASSSAENKANQRPCEGAAQSSNLQPTLCAIEGIAKLGKCFPVLEDFNALLCGRLNSAIIR